MRFDRRGGPLEADALDDIGVQGPLHQKAHLSDTIRFSLKALDEETPNDLPFPFRIGDRLQAFEKFRGAIKTPQVELEMGRKGLLNLRSFLATQQAVVDEHAGQLLSDGTMGQRRRDGRIHTAAQCADGLASAHRVPNLCDRRLDVGAHRPGRLAAAYVMHEVLQYSESADRVRDLGMKLQAIDPPAVRDRLHGGNRRVGRVGDRAESFGQPLDSIPVRHPDCGDPALPDSLEQIGVVINQQLGAAVLPPSRFGDLAVQDMRDQLHAVADTEHRQVLLKELLRHQRGSPVVDAGRPSGQDDPFRAVGLDRREGGGIRENLGIDLRFADAASDELCVLGPEVEDENPIVPEFHV